MKKLSVLVALMLIITVGGVYATWTYNMGNKPVDDRTMDISVQLTEKRTPDSPQGELTLTNNNLNLVVENKGEYIAELQGSGQIDVTYYHNNLSQANDEIYIKYKITVVSGKYWGDDVITADTEWYPITKDYPGIGGTISADELLDHIRLGDTFILGTPAEYDAFAAALNSTKITITVAQDDGTICGGGGQSGDIGDDE